MMNRSIRLTPFLTKSKIKILAILMNTFFLDDFLFRVLKWDDAAWKVLEHFPFSSTLNWVCHFQHPSSGRIVFRLYHSLRSIYMTSTRIVCLSAPMPARSLFIFFTYSYNVNCIYLRDFLLWRIFFTIFRHAPSVLHLSSLVNCRHLLSKSSSTVPFSPHILLSSL